MFDFNNAPSHLSAQPRAKPPHLRDDEHELDAIPEGYVRHRGTSSPYPVDKKSGRTIDPIDVVSRTAHGYSTSIRRIYNEEWALPKSELGAIVASKPLSPTLP